MTVVNPLISVSDTGVGLTPQLTGQILTHSLPLNRRDRQGCRDRKGHQDRRECKGRPDREYP